MFVCASLGSDGTFLSKNLWFVLELAGTHQMSRDGWRPRHVGKLHFTTTAPANSTGLDRYKQECLSGPESMIKKHSPVPAYLDIHQHQLLVHTDVLRGLELISNGTEPLAAHLNVGPSRSSPEHTTDSSRCKLISNAKAPIY